MDRHDLKPTDLYYVGWQDMARRQTLLAVSFLANGVSMATMVWFGEFPAMGVVIGSTFLWTMYSMVRHMKAPCPRCGKVYRLLGPLYWNFARRCLHCQLPLWAPRDPND